MFTQSVSQYDSLLHKQSDGVLSKKRLLFRPPTGPPLVFSIESLVQDELNGCVTTELSTEIGLLLFRPLFYI